MPEFSRRIFIAACAGLAAGRTAQAADTAAKQAPSPPASVIAGALLPLSGSLSLTGDECLRGIQLAADEINAGGGIAGAPLSLALGDAYDQQQSESIAQTLVTDGHASLFLGSGASALSYPGSAAAEIAQIPYIELTAPADGITARGFKFLLRTGPTTTMIANAALAAITQKFNGRKIGLLFNTGATAGAIAAAVLAAWAGQKITPLLVIGYPEDSVDLHGPIGRLKRAGVEILLHAADADDVLTAHAAMQDLSFRPPVIGCGDGYGLRETAFALGDAFDGTIIAAAPFYPPRAAYIAAAYQARYGMAPRSADSLTSFVGAKLVFDTLNIVQGDVTRLLTALRKTYIPPGTLANGFGTIFDKSGQNTASFVTLQQWRAQVPVPFA